LGGWEKKGILMDMNILEKIMCNKEYEKLSLEMIEKIYEYKYRIVINDGSIKKLVYEK